MQSTTRLLLLLLLPLITAAAQSTKPKPKKPQEKQKTEFEQLSVWADRIVYQGKLGKFVFAGKVTVIKDNLRVDCNDMEGSVDAKSRRLTKVSAVGKVRMITVASSKPNPKGGPPLTPAAPDAWRASCARADYDLKAGRLVLSGKKDGDRPRLWRAKGYGEADKIVFVPAKGEYELIGNPVIRGEIPTGPLSKPGDAGKPTLPPLLP